MFEIGKLFKTQNNNPTPVAPTQVKKKILIVEDETDISDIYQQILTEGGFDAQVAANGEEGLRKIVETSPNLILLDIKMPVMDGKTMLLHLKNDPVYANFKNIPVVMLSNSGTSDNIREAKTLGGANEFIIKANIRPDELVNIANKFIH